MNNSIQSLEGETQRKIISLLIYFLVLSILLLGCNALKIQKTDSIGKKLTKMAARGPLCLFSIGMSEDWFSIERTMQSWLGCPKSNLIIMWGPPNQIIPDNMGGEFIVYTAQRVFVSPGYSTTNATGYAYGNNFYAQSQTTYYPPQVSQWSVFRMFRADEYGTITAYSWKGL
jgi:hypothetical protein